MPLHGSLPRPLADSSLAPLAEVERRAHEREWFSSDLADEEDRLEAWHAVAMFGFLVTVEGLFFSLIAQGEFYVLVDVGLVLAGLLVFLLGSLVTPELGTGYGWAVLSAAGVAVLFGVYMQFNRLAESLTLSDLWSGVTTDLTGTIVRTMQLGGVVLAVFSLLVAYRVRRRIERE